MQFKLKRLLAYRYFLPLFFFILLFVLLWRGLGNDPTQIPSAMINKPLPDLTLKNLSDRKEERLKTMFNGRVTLLNIWASWCHSCHFEHKLWLERNKDKSYQLFGLLYQDTINSAQQYLNRAGNPYEKNWIDNKGLAAIELGAYGTPETFVIDKHGVIRYRHTGVVSNYVYSHDIEPLLSKLEMES